MLIVLNSMECGAKILRFDETVLPAKITCSRCSLGHLDTSAVCEMSFEPLSELARHIPALQAELFDVMSHRIADLETFETIDDP